MVETGDAVVAVVVGCVVNIAMPLCDVDAREVELDWGVVESMNDVADVWSKPDSSVSVEEEEWTRSLDDCIDVSTSDVCITVVVELEADSKVLLISSGQLVVDVINSGVVIIGMFVVAVITELVKSVIEIEELTSGEGAIIVM